MKHLRATITLMALAGLGALNAPALAADEALRGAFSRAWSRIASDPSDTRDDAALRGYVLYPYLEAERLRVRLSRGASLSLDREIESFLTRSGNMPAARIVRRPWLESLAARKQWERYLAAYAGAVRPEQALRCLALRARLALGEGTELAEAARTEWLTPRSAEPACDPVFAWMREQRLLTQDLVAERARRALQEGEAGLARWLSREVPGARGQALRNWALLLERPADAIDILIDNPQLQVDDEALLAGWRKLSRRDPERARDRFARLVKARAAGTGLASALSRELAVGLALSRHGQDALRAFERVRPEDFDDLAHEWQVRAALWTGDWPRTARALASMPATLRDEARWTYWQGRAAEALDQPEVAREHYRKALRSDNWYGVLASARLNQRFAPRHVRAGFDAPLLRSLEGDERFRRARELFLLEMIPQAQSEWNAAFESLEPAMRRHAAAIASAWGWHFQAIASAARQALFDDYELLYPNPYRAEVAEAARETGLPVTLLIGLIRQESLFQPYAVSSANAMGLMQLLPTTARQVSRRIGRPAPSTAELRKPAVNVRLGSNYLAGLVQEFGGQVPVALAAYNAGPNAARRWLPGSALELDAWVENIPYNETRSYVQRVMWHSVVFQWLEDRAAKDASSWLVKIRN
ncbi:MAG: transglycosylase SLT domain-containing protein [Steroidobacteraceae bacterium]